MKLIDLKLRPLSRYPTDEEIVNFLEVATIRAKLRQVVAVVLAIAFVFIVLGYVLYFGMKVSGQYVSDSLLITNVLASMFSIVALELLSLSTDHDIYLLDDATDKVMKATNELNAVRANIANGHEDLYTGDYRELP